MTRGIVRPGGDSDQNRRALDTAKASREEEDGDPEDREHLLRLRAAGPSAGLISLQGGWEGSDDLVREIEATGRSISREVPELD